MKIDKLPQLGESYSHARAALTSVHRRMQLDKTLCNEYLKFMNDFIQLGHMRPLSSLELSDESLPTHYIPHHGIWQRSDDRHKLRVVFNASRPTSSGLSLNDVLHVGPKLQTDLASVVIRWRRHRIAFCADIKMMFRQIRVDARDANLQRILWSPSKESPPVHYQLLTVTYGETCAPYLALHTLRQLCLDDGRPFPEAVDAIENDLYMDDFLTRGDDVTSAKRRRDEIVQLLQAGGFALKKWVSNTPELLATIDPADRLRPTWMNFCTGGPVNELGLAWDPVQDCFRFVPPPDCNELRLTKRTALAELARIFDPAGWIAPVTVIAKLAIQDLWRIKLDWDEPTPEPWTQEWLKFRASMKQIKTVSLPRWIGWEKTNSIQLHAFADASRRAMAAAVYFRSSNESVVSTSLLSAKTKLTLLKNLSPTTRPAARMTIPRMELRAALLAAKLTQFTSEHLKIPLTQCHLWSDSQVILHWLRSDGPTGHEFVDNYVQHIQEIVPEAIWHYVPTTDNPADVASRGTTVQHLGSFSLWWSEPAWLKNSPGDWPAQHMVSLEACQEEANPRNVACLTASLNSADTYPIERFSNLNRLLRTMTHCRRLCLRRTDTQASAVLSRITATDTRREWLACVRLSQQQDSEADINRLRQSLPIQKGNPLRALSPFLDDGQVLRVGGRLTHSQLPYDEKHPVILSGRSHLGRLLIDWAHLRALHAGFRVTYTYAIQRAWIIGGRVAVKSHLRKCTVCAKTLMKPQNPIMAPLPEARVSPCRPFSRCGVDYAGPFQLLRSSGRGVSSTKGYIALFVCLSSKAIHLELVADLTTQSFMGALTRFVGRRGRPREMWSDNGTNFRGANQELNRLLHAAQLSWGTVEERLAQDGISWHFIPPGAPHFEGIWEAGVKSAKTHLRRVVGPRKLTYEEFSTLLVEVETILNCRPLAPLSGEMDDIEALTPAHLLIGTSLTSVPRPTTDHVDLDQSTHWNLVRGMRDHFWSRWGKEYLNTLQQRVKWTRPSANLMPGDLVMVFDPSLLRPNG